MARGYKKPFGGHARNKRRAWRRGNRAARCVDIPPRRRTVRTSRRKLSDKKINTLEEKRMVEVAKQIVARERVNLILREYWHAAGMLRQFNKMSLGRKIYYDGYANKIATIDKVDVNFVVNAPADDIDPDLYIEPGDAADNDGAQQGMITETIMGRRQSDKIKISGFTLGVKAFFSAVQCLAQFSEAIGGSTQAAQPPNNVLKHLETVVLKYAIVGVLRDLNAALNPSDPLPEEMLKYPTWGYSPQLDEDEKANTLWIKKRTFLSGEMKCNINEIRHKDFTAERFVKLNNPLSVSYLPADQNGQQTTDWAFFVVFRSNVPDYAAGTQTHQYEEYAPSVTCYTKTHYFE